MRSQKIVKIFNIKSIFLIKKSFPFIVICLISIFLNFGSLSVYRGRTILPESEAEMILITRSWGYPKRFVVDNAFTSSPDINKIDINDEFDQGKFIYNVSAYFLVLFSIFLAVKNRDKLSSTFIKRKKLFLLLGSILLIYLVNYHLNNSFPELNFQYKDRRDELIYDENSFQVFNTTKQKYFIDEWIYEMKTLIKREEDDLQEYCYLNKDEKKFFFESWSFNRAFPVNKYCMKPLVNNRFAILPVTSLVTGTSLPVYATDLYVYNFDSKEEFLFKKSQNYELLFLSEDNNLLMINKDNIYIWSLDHPEFQKSHLKLNNDFASKFLLYESPLKVNMFYEDSKIFLSTNITDNQINKKYKITIDTKSGSIEESLEFVSNHSLDLPRFSDRDLTLNDFNFLQKGISAEEVLAKFPSPNKEIASGIYILQYELNSEDKKNFGDSYINLVFSSSFELQSAFVIFKNAEIKILI